MAITRTSTGFLFSDDFNRADGALGANWSVLNGAASIASNVLSCTANGTNVRTVAMADRNEMVYQGKVRLASSGNAGGPTIRHAGDNHSYYFQLQEGNKVNWFHRNPGYTSLGLFCNFAFAFGVYHPFKLHFRNSYQKGWFGATGAAVGTGSHAGMDAKLGTAGGHRNSSCNLDDVVCYSKNTVVMEGLPPGWKLRVGARVEVAIDGVATVDLDKDLCPLLKVEILDGSDNLIDDLTPPDGVWGGDVYDAGIAPPTNPTITSPEEDDIVDGVLAVAWSASVSSGGNPIEYTLDWTRDDQVWNNIVTDTSLLTADWAIPAELAGRYVTLRLIATDTVFGSQSAYVYQNVYIEGAVSLTEVTLLDDPVEYWKMEETTGDFLSSAPGGFDATAYVWVPTSQNGIETRGVDAAVCKGIKTIAPSDPIKRFFITQRPEAELFVDNFAIVQYVRPVGTTAFSVPVGLGGLNSDDKVLISPRHESSTPIPDTGIGLGLEVGTNGICVRQHSSGNLQPATTYQGPISDTEDSQVAMVVRQNGSTRTVELYLNGVYCADIPGGVYDEWSIVGTPLASWPTYGITNLNVSIPDYYGFTYEGLIDEVSWYDYALSARQLLDQYNAYLATKLVAPTEFTAPLDDIAISDGMATISWGAVVGADGYYLEVHDGVDFIPLAFTDEPTYQWDISGETPRENVQLRVRATLENFYGMESCGHEILTLSGLFDILAVPDIWVDPDPPTDPSWDGCSATATDWSDCPVPTEGEWESC